MIRLHDADGFLRTIDYFDVAAMQQSRRSQTFSRLY